MWYEVPESKPAPPQEKPKAIFPWEVARDRPPPTRVFVEDHPPQQAAGSDGGSPPTLGAASTTTQDSPSPGNTPTPPQEESQPFAPTVNLWDTVPGIERYVRAVRDAQSRRSARSSITLPSPIAVEELIAAAASGQNEPGKRRESLILTDFPTAVERPSLPVTPAPIRRTMWGDDKEAAGLTAAEGVPDQADWVCPRCGFSSDSPEAFLPRPVASAVMSAVEAGAFASTTAQSSGSQGRRPHDHRESLSELSVSSTLQPSVPAESPGPSTKDRDPIETTPKPTVTPSAFSPSSALQSCT